MTSSRIPALLVVLAALVGLTVLDRSDTPEVEVPVDVDAEIDETIGTDPGLPDTGQGPQSATPIGVPPDDSGASVWYCGAAAGDANDGITVAEILVVNVSDSDRTGVVTQFDDNPDTAPLESGVQVAAGSTTVIDLLSPDTARPAALVEMSGGGVVALIRMEGDAGFELASCSDRVSSSWFLPGGSTEDDSTTQLVLFNPFPDNATVNITVSATDGLRAPTAYERLLVPSQTVLVLDLGEEVQLHHQTAVAVESMSGSVVADLVITLDGSVESRKGLAILPGATQAADAWYFPDGRIGKVEQEFVLFNPSSEEAQVLLTVALDPDADVLAVAPFELRVPRHGYTVLSSSSDEWSRVPPGVAHSVSVISDNNVPVVAAQFVSFTDDARPGYAAMLGLSATASSWVVPLPRLDGYVSSVTVQSSASSRSIIEVLPFGGGPLNTELAEAERVTIPVDELDGTEWISVAAETQILVTQAFASEQGRSFVPGFPRISVDE